MKGSAVFYRVPSSQGWRVLHGTIVNVTPFAVVVKEDTFGGKSTIDPAWVVSYDWQKTKTTAEAVA